MNYYEILLLGALPADFISTLRITLAKAVKDFDLEIDRGVAFRAPGDFAARDPKAATVAIYYCGPDKTMHQAQLQELVQQAVPIIPIIPSSGSFGDAPALIAGSNGIQLSSQDPNHDGLASALLECVGLLYHQRRVFVSYRREESRLAAVQLHDALTARCFDVFLDTHAIRPGEPFQEVLWNRLCNCDVVVMIDTPSYFSSKWTRQEIGRARAKNIQVLRIVWPGHVPDKLTDLSETISLGSSDVEGVGGPLSESMSVRIALALESLRSRSIAARHRILSGQLQAEAIRAGATIDGIGAYRATGMTLLNGKKVWAYPVVGIPSAELINDIARKASGMSMDNPPILVYDDLGIRNQWADHLEWLNTHIGVVDMLKVSQAGWELAAWKDD